jgi:ligand-binding sensor domain-containing protein
MRLPLRLALAGSLGLVAPAAAQSASRDWRPSERTIIGDFSRITAIATSFERVYVASPTSLLVWQPQFRRWDGPYSPPDPAILNGVFAGLVDQLDQSLWLARSDGWVRFQPELQTWDHGRVGEGVLSIAFDQDDPIGGLYLRTRSGWLLLPRGGIAPTPSRPPSRPVAPTSVEELLRSNPTLQANAAQILLDDRQRPVRYTAAARAVDNSGWYLGTSGVGLLFLPDGAGIPERIPFGLPALPVGAVLSWPGGVWVATQRTPQAEASLTFVGQELAEFSTVRGLRATGVPFTKIAALAGQGRSVFAATDYGLARVDPREGRYEMLDERRGLPDSRVYSVAARQGRITVGTARGIARLDDSLHLERLAPNFVDAAYAVFPAGDSVWVGTTRGVLLARPGDHDLVRPAALSSGSLQVPITAFAALGDTIVALTRDQLLWRDPRTGAWTLGPNLSGLLGRLRALAADGPGLWVAGQRGIGFSRLGTPAVRTLSEGDLPGNATGLSVDPEFLWVGTASGLARFRLDAIRP